MVEGTKSIREFYEIPAEDIMDTKRPGDLPLIEKDAGIESVLSALTGSDYVWVVESKGSKKLVGIITEHDILNLFSPRKKVSFFGLPNKKSLHYESFEKAGHIMSRNPIRSRTDEKVKDVLNKMIDHRVRRIPVVENDEILGEITLHHLIKQFHAYMSVTK